MKERQYLVASEMNSIFLIDNANYSYKANVLISLHFTTMFINGLK